jgi:hypothetical protein
MRKFNSTLKILFLTAFFGFILRGPLLAQVVVNVAINPPYTQFAEAYLAPFKANITLFNTGARDSNVQLQILRTKEQEPREVLQQHVRLSCPQVRR